MSIPVCQNVPVVVVYKNWRGEVQLRTIVPINLWFGSTIFHPGMHWFVRAADPADNDKVKDFALDGFQTWNVDQEGAPTRCTASPSSPRRVKRCWPTASPTTPRSSTAAWPGRGPTAPCTPSLTSCRGRGPRKRDTLAPLEAAEEVDHV